MVLTFHDKQLGGGKEGEWGRGGARFAALFADRFGTNEMAKNCSLFERTVWSQIRDPDSSEQQSATVLRGEERILFIVYYVLFFRLRGISFLFCFLVGKRILRFRWGLN